MCRPAIFFATSMTPNASREDRVAQQLLDHESVYTKPSDYHTDTISAFHKVAFVGEHHPVRLACLGGAALPQLPNLFHAWHHQLHARLFVHQEWGGLLVVQTFGLLDISHAVAETDHLA